MNRINNLNVEWTADHNQYFQGHGIAFTDWDACATGCGETLNEAIEDALEQLAEQDITISHAQEQEIRDQIRGELKQGYGLETTIVDAQCPERGEHALCTCGHEHGMRFAGGPRGVVRDNRCVTSMNNVGIECACGDFEQDTENVDCAVCAGDWHFYVSVDVKTKEQDEAIEIGG